MIGGTIVFGVLMCLCLIPCIFFGIKYFRTKEDIGNLSSCLVSLSIACMFLIPFSMFLHGAAKEYQEEIPIVSLSKDSETSGSFILGTGYIKETRYYFFYIDLGNNRYQEGNVRADSTIIVETNDIKPCLLITKEAWHDGERIELYVPVGTIVKEFKV